MGRVADTQQTRPIPVAKPIDQDGQKLYLVPILQFIHAIFQERSYRHDVGAKGFETASLDLRSDKAPEHLAGIASFSREPKPHYIDWCAKAFNLQAGEFAHN